jgi:hypothetical protein
MTRDEKIALPTMPHASK